MSELFTEVQESYEKGIPTNPYPFGSAAHKFWNDAWQYLSSCQEDTEGDMTHASDYLNDR